MDGIKNAYRIVFENLKGKTFNTPRNRQNDNIKMDHKAIGCEGVG